MNAVFGPTAIRRDRVATRPEDFDTTPIMGVPVPLSGDKGGRYVSLHKRDRLNIFNGGNQTSLRKGTAGAVPAASPLRRCLTPDKRHSPAGLVDPFAYVGLLGPVFDAACRDSLYPTQKGANLMHKLVQKKKLVSASIAGAALIALVLGGSTYASWTASKVIADNEVGAGTLTLTVDPDSRNIGDPLRFDNVKLAPGQGFERNIFLVSNDSDSVPNAELFATFMDVYGHEDGCNGDEELVDPNCSNPNSQGQFAEAVLIQTNSYAAKSAGECAPTSSTATSIRGQFGGNLRYLAAKSPIEITGPDGTAHDVLEPGEGICYRVEVVLPEKSTNATQGDSATFNLVFTLEQSNKKNA